MGSQHEKLFKRWNVEVLLELSIQYVVFFPSNMQYEVIEERLVKPLRKKWKMLKGQLEYYTANINTKCWVDYKAILLIDHI